MDVPATAVRDADALRSCLRGLRAELPVPLFFAGLGDEEAAVQTELLGHRTSGLRHLRVRRGAGLGGRALAEARPAAVRDYRTARGITHEYDRPVLGEGVTSILVAPVVVEGAVRGLVYCGSRGTETLGDAALRVVAPHVRRLADEIRVRDEVDRRVALADVRSRDGDPAEVASLREVLAELRTIAATVDDPALRSRLDGLGDRLVPTRPERRVLTRRELDVLGLVALGCGNAEVASRLDLGVETVRSYLRNAMRKLDAHTRLEAVAAARRHGELL